MFLKTSVFSLVVLSLVLQGQGETRPQPYPLLCLIRYLLTSLSGGPRGSFLLLTESVRRCRSLGVEHHFYSAGVEAAFVTNKAKVVVRKGSEPNCCGV